MTYSAPFELGPKGGDTYNLVQAEPGGRITVARLDPRPGAISCNAKAGYARLLVHHDVTAPVASVTVAFTEALADPYVVVSAGVRDQNGRWIGFAHQRGAAGDGAFDITLEPVDETAPTALTIEFGLAVSSACPTVDGGTVRFTQVTVHGE